MEKTVLVIGVHHSDGLAIDISDINRACSALLIIGPSGELQRFGTRPGDYAVEKLRELNPERFSRLPNPILSVSCPVAEPWPDWAAYCTLSETLENPMQITPGQLALGHFYGFRNHVVEANLSLLRDLSPVFQDVSKGAWGDKEMMMLQALAIVERALRGPKSAFSQRTRDERVQALSEIVALARGQWVLRSQDTAWMDNPFTTMRQLGSDAMIKELLEAPEFLHRLNGLFAHEAALLNLQPPPIDPL